jgi:post-segregation antitoxin (ccd killing protein)
MAYWVFVEIVLSETALRAAKEYGIDISQIAIDAVYHEIKSKIEAGLEMEQRQKENSREELRRKRLKLQQEQERGTKKRNIPLFSPDSLLKTFGL